MSNEKITWPSFLKLMMTIAFPVALQNLLSTTAGMVDTIMIGSMGELAVAAVGICSQISSLFFSCYWGFAGGAMLFFAQYWGARNEKGINQTFGVTFIFMTIVGSLFAVTAVTNPTFMLGIYTDKEHIIQMGAPYIRIVGFAYPLQVFAVLVSFFMRATERVKAPLFCSIASLLVNFALNWVLIYGRFGAPKMGVAGAAVGTLASGIVNLALLVIFLLASKCEIRLRLREMFGFQREFIGAYLSKCLPILANEMLYGVGQMIINIVIGHQNESAIAAMAAFRVCEGFVYAFFGGLSNAASVIIGKEVGSGHLPRAYNYCRKSSLFCPMVTFGVVGVMALFNRPILGLFGLGSTALEYGKFMLLIYLAFGTIRTCNYIMNESYRAGGEAVFGTVLEVSCLFLISVPATWIAGMVFRLPFLAVFAFVYTDEIIRLLVETRYTASGKWIKPVTEQGIRALPQFREWVKTRT
ncbi:MAG: MATE family efflux transporter [Lachnospiraceae bacterium]|nr:MATE family efflux transporter [Lachnospiraceae bacterium]